MVTVALVAVKFVKNAVSAVKTDVKKLVEVALVVDEFVAKKLVAVAEVSSADCAERLVVVLLVDELFVLYIDVAVSPVVEAFVKVVCPVTVSVPVAVMLVAVRLEVEALPKKALVVVILVKTGFGETAMVEVDERTMLEPAMR